MIFVLALTRAPNARVNYTDFIAKMQAPFLKKLSALTPP
jgi:hypothetical protein